MLGFTLHPMLCFVCLMLVANSFTVETAVALVVPAQPGVVGILIVPKQHHIKYPWISSRLDTDYVVQCRFIKVTSEEWQLPPSCTCTYTHKVCGPVTGARCWTLESSGEVSELSIPLCFFFSLFLFSQWMLHSETMHKNLIVNCNSLSMT